MHVESSYFLIFQNILGTKKNFRNRKDFFQVLLGTILYKRSGTFNETFLTWSSLTCNIFSIKSWFLFSDNSHAQKSGDVITCFFCTVKNKTSEAARLIVGNPPPYSVLSFSKCLCLCLVYLHHFHQCYLCFTGRT